MGWNCVLLPSLDQTLGFDSPRIEDALRSIEGMSIAPLRLEVDAAHAPAVEFLYKPSTDRTSVTVGSDFGWIMIHERATLTALALSLAIQRAYAKEICFLLGDDLESAIPLSEVATPEQLWMLISGEPYEE